MTVGGTVSHTIPLCRHCKSSRILADAYAQWDADLGDWSLTTTFDNYVCLDCDGETKVIWRLETEAKERADHD